MAGIISALPVVVKLPAKLLVQHFIQLFKALPD